jgi:phosphatidate cytidylyltransferase
MLIKRILTAVILLGGLTMAVLHFPHAQLYPIIALILLLIVCEAAIMYKFELAEIVLLLLLNIGLILAITFLYHTTNIKYLKHWHALMLFFRLTTFIFWLVIVPNILWQSLSISKIQIAWLVSIITMTAYNGYMYLFNKFGLESILSMIALAWVADTIAYFVGKMIGNHKIAPAISPGKSWEGAIGGCLACVIYFLILQHMHIIHYISSPIYGIAFSVFIAIMSIEGDLLESWAKRVVGVKDSGNLLPGHGGIWDRMDSLVAVIALSFMLL